MAKLEIKRVYEPRTRGDGQRVLVDRVWPRGVKKDTLRLDGWLKDVAPSTALRKWFGHDPAKWDQFQRRYREELRGNADAVEPLRKLARRGTVTLVYAAHDRDHNSAVVLTSFLERRATRPRAKKEKPA